MTAELTAYRPAPLTAEEYRRLDALAEKAISIKEKLMPKSVPVMDTNGEIYRWERDLVPCGIEVHFRIEPDERLMESLMRPAAPTAIAKHLTDLAAHKPYGRGEGGFQVIVRDMLHDLAGCSEWALLKTCEHFRLSRNSRFFPDSADLVHAAKSLDEQVRWAYASRGKPAMEQARTPSPQPAQVKTDEGRANIAKVLHDAGIPHDKQFCEQCKQGGSQ